MSEKLKEALAYLDGELIDLPVENPEKTVYDAARRVVEPITDEEVERSVRAMIDATAEREGHIPDEMVLRAIWLGVPVALERFMLERFG